ncbi:MAG: (2Fe-2S)-binding protein [Candidatus Dormibacteraeota bacterium]|uniref:(2Fe-2S)-binding protein n=1 Tax=Candidatus Nephthysia bennettiae TaxID=3127016 RepID=A0A934N3N9_9BACT|nr:(2Fe-2S)-binding protein [Candidatus Dormibacteraeota bacterium]MBJ7611982.1 (2Fe-2S)-binding protein [Candidatus Dormibacteraeota bacterium]
MALSVNGEPWGGEVEPRLTLADLLRDRLGQHGTHLGCEHGVCGACTVLLDGEPVRSCLALAVQADGSAVTTVEGLPPTLLPESAFQCGFCRGGFMVSAAALLGDGRRRDRDQLRELLAGNICRCTGYEPIIEALYRAQP